MSRFIDTAWLTQASFRPTAPDRDRRRRQLAAVALLLVVAVAAGHGFAGDLFMTVRDRAALRAERDQLAATVERLRTEMAVESAKRRELERHSADLNAQVAELNGQVEFLRARRPLAKSAE